MLEIGFGSYHLKETIIKCQESNSKSAAVALRLGFIEVSKELEASEINGKKEDVRVFRLVREDYVKKDHWDNDLKGKFHIRLFEFFSL